MSRDVFISYSSTNKEIADAVCAKIESRGISCWYAPRNITPGEDWAESIIHGISQAKIMVLIYTDDSNKSGQVLREVAHAASSGLIVIPFKLTKSKPMSDLGGYLQKTHWMDVVNLDMSLAIDKLSKRCELLLNRIYRHEQSEEKRASLTRGQRVIRGLCIAFCAALLATVLICVGVTLLSDKSIDPSESSLVASVNDSYNGIQELTLKDGLNCNVSGMTCDEYVDRYVQVLGQSGGNWSAQMDSKGLSYDICKNDEPTGYSLIFTDTNTSIITGNKQICIAGLSTNNNNKQSTTLKYTEAFLATAYSELDDKEITELALVMYGEDCVVHAWSDHYELYCESGEEFSLTILDSATIVD